MLSHGNLAFQVAHLSQYLPVQPGDSVLALLPPWHVYQRSCANYCFSRAARVVRGVCGSGAGLERGAAAQLVREGGSVKPLCDWRSWCDGGRQGTCAPWLRFATAARRLHASVTGGVS